MREVTIPGVLLTNASGSVVRPAVLLYGAESGKWQAEAARGLQKAAGQVIRTDVETYPRGKLHPTTAWQVALDYFAVADVIVCWCGNDQDALYLCEWTWLGWALEAHLRKMVLGVPQEPSHPMAAGLRFLANEQRLGVHTTLENVIAATVERCRAQRGQ
jgi:hypothetical protein